MKIAGTTLALLIGWSAAAEAAEFRITNMSGKGVAGVYLTPEESELPSEINLLQAAVPAGETAALSINVEESACNFHLRIEFEDLSAFERRGMDLCQVGELVVE